jgi:hypothetical protein
MRSSQPIYCELLKRERVCKAKNYEHPEICSKCNHFSQSKSNKTTRKSANNKKSLKQSRKTATVKQQLPKTKLQTKATAASSKRHKAKWDWDGGGLYSFPYLTENDFKKIVKVLHISKINEENRSRIQEAVRHYFVDKDYFSNIPRSAKVKAALLEVRTRTKKLIDCLEALDPVCLEKLARTSVFPKVEIYDLVDGQSDCYKIHSATEEALGTLEIDRGGPHRTKDALRNFICGLAFIFEELMKTEVTLAWNEYKEIYQGEFYDFVQGCLEIIDPDAITSNISLGKQIGIALKNNRLSYGRNLTLFTP